MVPARYPAIALSVILLSLVLTPALLTAQPAHAESYEYEYWVGGEKCTECLHVEVDVYLAKTKEEIKLEIEVAGEEGLFYNVDYFTLKTLAEIMGPDGAVLAEREAALEWNRYSDDYQYDNIDIRVPVSKPGEYIASITLKASGNCECRKGQERFSEDISWEKTLTYKIVFGDTTTMAAKEDKAENRVPSPLELMLYNPYAQAMFVLGVMIVIAVYVYGRAGKAEK